MSSGEGEKSRIYKTTDGGQTWRLQYTDKRKEFFLDTIACLTALRCLALGDPIDGKFLLLLTIDGEHWNTLPRDRCPRPFLPKAHSPQAILASCFPATIFFSELAALPHASSTPLTRDSPGRLQTPIAHGNASSGIFSIASTNGNQVVVVGGDYQDPERASRSRRNSSDRGRPGDSPRSGPAAIALPWPMPKIHW